MSNEIERRWLLVRKATEIMPLDQAFDLAQKIEVFIVFGIGHRPADLDGLNSVQAVITYLRNQGNSVSVEGTGYQLNGQVISFAELVHHANEKRQQQGLSQFCFYTHNPGPDGASAGQ